MGSVQCQINQKYILFTFHCGSIMGCRLILFLLQLLLFTFHCGSIMGLANISSVAHIMTLHSTVVLLWDTTGDSQSKGFKLFTFHCGSIMGATPDVKILLMLFLYIPLWFYYGLAQNVDVEQMKQTLHSTVVLLWVHWFNRDDG